MFFCILFSTSRLVSASPWMRRTRITVLSQQSSESFKKQTAEINSRHAISRSCKDTNSHRLSTRSCTALQNQHQQMTHWKQQMNYHHALHPPRHHDELEDIPSQDFDNLPISALFLLAMWAFPAGRIPAAHHHQLPTSDHLRKRDKSWLCNAGRSQRPCKMSFL